MHLAARPRQRLCQDSADGAVVIGDKNGSVHGSDLSHCGGVGGHRASFGAMGSDRRNTVRPGTESTAIHPS